MDCLPWQSKEGDISGSSQPRHVIGHCPVPSPSLKFFSTTGCCWASLMPQNLVPPPQTPLSGAGREHHSLFSYHPNCSQEDPSPEHPQFTQGPMRQHWGRREGWGERGRRMREQQPATSGRMRALPSMLRESPPKPTPLQETTSQELQGTEQTQVEHGSQPTWDNILKRTHVIREEGKTMFKTCLPPPHNTHTRLFLASTWSKQWSQPKPRSVNNAWSQLRPPTQEGMSGGTDGRLMHTGHRSAVGTEMPAPPQCSSVTRQENVGLPQRAMKCEARSYEWMGTCQPSWGRHQELEWFVSPLFMS